MSAFNQKPIRINTPMAQSFWTILRAAGVLAASQGKPIEVISIKWIDPGATASYSITDASISNNILDQGDTGPDYVGGDLQNVFPPGVKRWRDWQVVILTGGELQIDYR
jgi:hypothetical protein